MRKFYASSFALVHYLNADPKRRKQMFIYLRALNHGLSVDDAFKGAFKMEYSELDDLLNDYIHGKYLMARTFQIGKGNVEFPEFAVSSRVFPKKDALAFLVLKIAMISDDILGAENRNKMFDEFNVLYPGFFK